MGFFSKLFDPTAGEIKRLNKLVDKIDSFEEAHKKLTDAQLREKTAEFKARYEKGETLDDCARRELMEETGLAASALLPAGVFSAPGRDPRGWIISGAFLSVVCSGANEIRGGDDAAEAVWCGVSLDVAPNGGKALLLLTPEGGQPPFEVAL